MLTDYSDPYVEIKNDNLYLRQTRVQLESVIRSWLEGEGPEAIRDGYSHVSLATIYGAIAYYLAHQAEVDAHFASRDAEFLAQQRAVQARDPERYALLRRRLDSARATGSPARDADVGVQSPVA